MKLIIIPTDFSPVATNAMHYGLQMAKKIKSAVMLLHVYNVPVSITEVPVLLVSVEDIRKDAETRLADLKAIAQEVCGPDTKIYVETRMGNMVEELEAICIKTNPFAVVMGTKGASGLDRVLFGSNALSAIKHLTSPVLVIPPDRQFGTGIHKIGMACDFRNITETTPAGRIKSLVKEFGATLDVLNVDYHEKHFTTDTPEESMNLHTMLEGVKPVYHFIENRDVEAGIDEFAVKNNLDLVISIPKKHRLLDSLFQKSTSKKLVFESHVPVMCIHED